MQEVHDYRFENGNLATWFLVRQTWTLMQMSLEKALGKVGLTPENVFVLWICKESEARGEIVTPAGIARILFRRDQSVVGLLNRMESNGLVKRNLKRRGHPFTEIKMTEKGKDVCETSVPLIKSVISRTDDISRVDEDLRESLNACLIDVSSFLASDLHMERKVISANIDW